MPGQQVRFGKQKRKEVYAVTVKISAKSSKKFRKEVELCLKKNLNKPLKKARLDSSC